MARLSIRRAFASKRIMLIGATGFLGKVWLTDLLARLPEIERIYLLVRRKRGQSARERFDQILASSIAFSALDRTDRFHERVTIVEGDAASPGLGIADPMRGELQASLDLIVNCAGIVDFEADLKTAHDTNVRGSLEALEFARACRRAGLLHVSTCFVSGDRSGTFEESVAERAPNGSEFDAERELASIRRELSNGSDGAAMASRWGWPNTYTYSKALAEQLLWSRRREVPLTILRPAIVEGALERPMAGWNEGFNTVGPLAYVLGTWVRHIPMRAEHEIDIVPVDLVSDALTIASAALLERRHAHVYQCGTSDLNPVTVGRLVELTALSHRAHRFDTGISFVERSMRARWDAVPAAANAFFRPANLRTMASIGRRLAERLHEATEVPELLDLRDRLSDADRLLEQVEDIARMYKPFIHDNRQVYVCRALKAHALEEDEFQFNPEGIDWRRYWLDKEMPGLRRWCFPALEGRALPRRDFGAESTN